MEQGKIVIRRAKIEDTQQIARLMADFDLLNQENIEDYYSATFDECIAYTEHDLAQKTARHFVAADGEKLVAYLFSYRIEEIKYYFIDSLYVQPDYRGRSVAQNLMKEVEKLAKTDDYLVKLEVFEWNKTAVNFYYKCGYTNEGLILEKNP
jgi:ribosomal protein S18 acetylase RimI-like enzyme